MDCIILQGLSFYGRHGNLPEETKLGQRFIIDLKLFLGLQPAGDNDNLSQSICYDAVYQLVREYVENRQFRLIETLAEQICQALLSAFNPLEQVSIQVRKPEAPLPGIFDYVAVALTRSRK